MTNWFDLPSEVKQIIFSYVPESDSIIYVPRDRRKTIDLRHLNSYHFHDLLLVSKTFITADEFAFAVLSQANLLFHNFNELRRFVSEVKPAVKEAVRTITFVRYLVSALYPNWQDGFEGFSNIPTTLSTHFPNLKQITVITEPYCAEIGYYGSWQPPSSAQFDQMVTFILQSDQNGTSSVGKDSQLAIDSGVLSNAVASCIGNRSTRRNNFAWTRPQPWLRRLILYAEDAGIEVVFPVELCISGYSNQQGSEPILTASIDTCFSRQYQTSNFWSMHVSSEMSTKDYKLRVKHDDIEYAFYQKLAHDMIHAPTSKGSAWWMHLLRNLDTGNRAGRFGF